MNQDWIANMNSPSKRNWLRGLGGVLMALSISLPALGEDVVVTTDPVSRYFQIAYPVPEDAPETIQVLCTFSLPGSDHWQKARVAPFVSETAYNLTPTKKLAKRHADGRIVERRAAGLQRTLVFNPYPEAFKDGKVDADFRIELRGKDDAVLARYKTRLKGDQSDVFYLEDWSQVFQKQHLQKENENAPQKWKWREGWDTQKGMSLGNSLYGDAGKTVPMPQLSYPLDLKGWYAIYVKAPGSVRLRLTGDERNDLLSSRPGEEVLWRWAKLDHQNLVVKQHHNYMGYVPSIIDYVKFVPLTAEQRASLDAPFTAPHDKLIAGYWEPYSYAFHDNVQDTLWHRQYLTAYPEANIDLVDMQIGRMGMKVVYESRLTENLYQTTMGDPIGTVSRPLTDNVGRMQQFTNTLQTSVRHADELGVKLHANFGASNCYPGSPLQGKFSKDHPEWMRGSSLRYEVPEVRAYALGLYRESLELGARGISIDYCRYPGCIDVAETANLFQKELRALADEFSAARGKPVPILIRFPAAGVNSSKKFDFATWAKEGWVDYLCPSNIQGRHNHFDITAYKEAVQGTKCILLPSIDGLYWGNPLPGPFLWRAKQLYDAGAPGLYVYQADSRVLGKPTERRTMRMLGSSQAIQNFWKEDARLRPVCSKGIYITQNMQIEGWHGWQRLRVWTEGIAMGPMEFYLDGKLIDKKAGPPYLLGTEDHASDRVIPPGKHTLKIRAQDGDGWLEQTFTILGAG